MSKSTRRSASGSRRIGVVVTVVSAALLLGSFSVPAWAAAEPPVTAITPQDLPQEPVPPLKDALGAPDASNLIQSDKLLFGDASGDSVAYTAATGADAATITSGQDRSTLVDLHKNYPTASGRFGDDKAERVLALHDADLGTSSALVLSSPTSVLENQTLSGPLPGLPAAGTTVQFENCGDGCDAKWVLTASSDQTGGALGYDAEGGVSLTASHWYVRTPVAGDAATFQFVNALTGQCLAAAGTIAGTAGCSLSSDAVDASQLWQVAFGGYLKNLGPAGGYLSNVDPRTFTLSADPGDGDNYFALLSIDQPGGVLPSFGVPFASRDASRPSDLATGDLDRAVNAAGHYADEAAVAYFDEQKALHVTVVDYDAPNGVITTDTTGFPAAEAGGTLGVEIGDYNGDTNNEIAVVYQNAAGQFDVSFIAYRAPGMTEILKSPSDPVFANGYSVGLSPTYAVASSDVTGTGRAQLSVSYTPRGAKSPVLEVVSFDNSWAAEASARQDISSDTSQYDITSVSGCENIGSTFWCSHAHRLESALLQVPAGVDDFARRQLVFAWTTAEVIPYVGKYGLEGYDVTPFTCYAAVGVDPGLTTTDPLQLSAMGTRCEQLANAGRIKKFDATAPQIFRAPIQLAAGAYNGRNAQSGELPVWGVTTLRAVPGSNLTTMVWNTTTKQWDWHYSAVGVNPGPGTLTAYDQNDTSLRLGAPLTVQLDSDQQPTVIAAAPPAHVDWIWNNTDGKVEFTNLTAYPATNLTMGSSTSSTFSSTATSQVSGSIGVSTAISVGETLKTNAVVVAAKESADVTVAASAAEALAKSNTTGNTNTTTLSSSSRTVSDDLLRVKTVSQTIFRYPILGGGIASAAADIPCADACFGYYDVVVPGSVTDEAANVGGRNVDWYQPTWLNGNALSYPTVREEFAGPYTGKDDSGDVVTRTQDLATAPFSLGGSESTTELTVSNDDKASYASSAATTLKESLGVKLSEKATVTVGLASGEERGSFSSSIDASQVFGKSRTGSTTTESDSSMTLSMSNVSQGPYDLNSYYYYDAAGVVKVNHTVNLRSALGTEWWTREYGETPDPALSLPNAINIDANFRGSNELPRFATGFDRQKIRGIEALQPSDTGDPKDATAYATAPAAGDEVTFAVPVHNFSLIQARDTTVEFFAVPVKSDTGDPIGAPEQIGGAKTVAEIAPQGIETVYSDTWKAIGVPGDGAQRVWHIFVVLNRLAAPDSETHSFQAAPAGTSGSNNLACPSISGNDNFESPANGTSEGGKLIDPLTGTTEGILLDEVTQKRAITACGSNNQGWFELTVQSAKAPSAKSDAAAVAAVAPNVRLAGAGFRTNDDSHLTLTEESPVPQLQQGIQTEGFVTVDADANSSAHQTVLVYDGLPEEGGTVIASTTVHGVSANEPAHAKFTWTPTTAGRHQLYQKILAEQGTGGPDAQIVTVDVVPAGGPVPPTSEPTPGPTATGSADPSASPSPQPSSTSDASTADDGLAGTGLALPLLVTIASLVLLVGAALAFASRRRLIRARRGE